MDYIEVVIGLIALAIAVRALNLQRFEIIKNGRITALMHTSNMIQGKIDYHSKIINDLKVKERPYEEWEGHAARINKEFRPLKERVDHELLDLMGRHDGVIQVEEVKRALKNKD